jgi:hypothetical protein
MMFSSSRIAWVVTGPCSDRSRRWNSSGNRRIPYFLVVVVGHHEGDGAVGAADPGDDRGHDVGELGAYDQEPFGVGLGRGDLQPGAGQQPPRVGPDLVPADQQEQPGAQAAALAVAGREPVRRREPGDGALPRAAADLRADLNLHLCEQMTIMALARNICIADSRQIHIMSRLSDRRDIYERGSLAASTR